MSLENNLIEFEQLILSIKECFVYKVPPLRTASGHRLITSSSSFLFFFSLHFHSLLTSFKFFTHFFSYFSSSFHLNSFTSFLFTSFLFSSSFYFTLLQILLFSSLHFTSFFFSSSSLHFYFKFFTHFFIHFYLNSFTSTLLFFQFTFYFNRAEEWGLEKPLFTGHLKIFQSDVKLKIILYRYKDESTLLASDENLILFAECPIAVNPKEDITPFVDSVIDSSRYFVLR